MGITLSKFLNDYFGVDELKMALSDIGELTTGQKNVLIKRLIAQWEPHNRDKYDLLEYLDEDYLSDLCIDYNIDADGDENLLRRRIKKAKLLDDSPRPSSMVDDRLISNKKTFEKIGLVNSDSKTIDSTKPIDSSHTGQSKPRINWVKWGAIFGGIAVLISIISLALPYLNHLNP